MAQEVRRPTPTRNAPVYFQPSPSRFVANTVTQTSGFPSSSPGFPPPPFNTTPEVPLLLGLRFRIPQDAWMSVCCKCCQVEVSALDWSLIQRCPTECGVYKWAWWWSLDNFELLTHEGGWRVMEKRIITSVLHTYLLDKTGRWSYVPYRLTAPPCIQVINANTSKEQCLEREEATHSTVCLHQEFPKVP